MASEGPFVLLQVSLSLTAPLLPGMPVSSKLPFVSSAPLIPPFPEWETLLTDHN